MKRGRAYHGCGEEYNVEKGKWTQKGMVNIEAVWKNIKWEKGEGDASFWGENQDKNNEGKKLFGTLCTPGIEILHQHVI